MFYYQHHNDTIMMSTAWRFDMLAQLEVLLIGNMLGLLKGLCAY